MGVSGQRHAPAAFLPPGKEKNFVVFFISDFKYSDGETRDIKQT
jgi:hypothetical protein